MDDWIQKAKDTVRQEAEDFVESMRIIAADNNLDDIWFIEEVVKTIHALKEAE